MLTKDLLLFRVRDGQVRPRLVDPADPALGVLAQDLLRGAGEGVGRPHGELLEDLAMRAGAAAQPKLGKGLLKLIDDKLELADPGPGAFERRRGWVLKASAARSALSADAQIEHYEALLAADLGPLAQLRPLLYADLPERCVVTRAPVLEPKELLARYNLAQVQGLLLHARAVRLQLPEPPLLELRRVLSWLKFCRLVAEVQMDGADLILSVDGPSSLFKNSKGYGLQLAQFFGAVPLLPRFRLQAEIELPRRGPARLELSERDGLSSLLPGPPGYVPEEIQAVLSRFDAGPWQLDAVPTPRPVGVRGVLVPDLVLRHKQRGWVVAVELFHAFHKGPLSRRLDELVERPDADLYLGVDKALWKDAALAERLERSAQVFAFNKFPSAKIIRALLDKRYGESN